MSQKLLQAIKQAAIGAVEQSAPTAITYGVVINTQPLEINVEQRLIIPAEAILLTSNVIDKKTKISFDNPTIKNIVKDYNMADIAGQDYKLTFQQKIENEVTIYNGLKQGDKVLLLRIQGGQKYIVLDRLVSG